MFGFLKRRRRERLRAMPLAPAAARMLEAKMALYRRMPEADRAELHGHIQVFLAEKRFEGCGGQGITEEVRLLVAAQACLLLLHRATDYFPTVSSILVYPTAYIVKQVEAQAGGFVSEEEDIHVGEAWRHDLLVLAWDEVAAGAAEEGGAVNVVLHEFAHALDHEDGEADGAPLLTSGAATREWSRVMKAAYDQLCKDADHGRDTVLDPYGAEDPAEFFAVVTEAFFQYPGDLRDAHPEMYEQFKAYFRQDPALW